MNVSMTRGSTAHVVLLPGGAVGEALLERVGVWTGEGLLDPVFWVPASSVLEHPTMPASIKAVVLGRTIEGSLARREVPLLSTIGLNAVSDLVVTCVRWLAPGQTHRIEVADASRRLLEAIKLSMPLPRQVEEVKVGGTQVRSLNVVFAATRVTSDELAELLSTDWEENILVSPEDRPRPGAADRFTDAADVGIWASFVAASVATLAGLWSGYSAQMIPRTPGSGMASSVPQVRVARTFVRGVLSGDFAVEVARDAAAALAHPSSPLLDPKVAFYAPHLTAIVGEEAERQVARAVDYVLAAESGYLTYRGLDETPQPKVAKVSWGRAIASFLSFSVDKLISIPTWITEWFAERAAAKTQQALMGEGSDASIDARGDLGLNAMDRDIYDVSQAIAQVQQQVIRALEQPPIPVTRASVPTLWSALRGTIFTLVDGGSPSEGMGPLLIDDKVALVADMGLVIPAPWEIWRLPANAAKHLTGREDTETVVTWTELAAARELLAHLTERSQDLELRHHEIHERYSKSRTDLISTERDYVEARETWEDMNVALEEADEDRRLAMSIRGEWQR